MSYFLYYTCLLLIIKGVSGIRKDNVRSSYGIYYHPYVSMSGKENRHYDNVENFTIYLGFTNNPFGPSKRLVNIEKENYLQDKEDIIDFKTYETDPKSTGNGVRSKRGVIHLYNMLNCATGCNPISYKGYGCFCGFLGSGYAVDGIDRCCKSHDWCYDTANCPMYLEYFVPYYWTCFKERPLCAVEHGEYGGYGSCAQKLCECDRILSECLSKYPCPTSRAICKTSPWRFLQNALMLF